MGFYFTGQYQIAEELADTSKRKSGNRFGYVIPVYLNITNPIVDIKSNVLDKLTIIKRANELGNKNKDIVNELGNDWVLSEFSQNGDPKDAFDVLSKLNDLE